MAKIKIGKRCTVSDTNQLQETSYVWFVSKEALNSFDKRINKTNCGGKHHYLRLRWIHDFALLG